MKLAKKEIKIVMKYYPYRIKLEHLNKLSEEDSRSILYECTNVDRYDKHINKKEINRLYRKMWGLGEYYVDEDE